MTTAGHIIVQAVIRAGAVERAIVEENGTVFVWAANADEQIEAALAEEGWLLVPLSAGLTSQEYEEAAGDMREVTSNLGLLLRRTSRKLDPSDPLRSQCVEYLKKIGQAGQPLRPWSQ